MASSPRRFGWPGGLYPWMQDSRAEILEDMPLFDALAEVPPGSTVQDAWQREGHLGKRP